MGGLARGLSTADVVGLTLECEFRTNSNLVEYLSPNHGICLVAWGPHIGKTGMDANLYFWDMKVGDYDEYPCRFYDIDGWEKNHFADMWPGYKTYAMQRLAIIRFTQELYDQCKEGLSSFLAIYNTLQAI